MLDNITSSRIDYKSFLYNEPFTESPYFSYLKEPIDKKSILILPKGKADLSNIDSLVKKLLKKKFNIYMLDTARELISYDKINFIKKGSNEYIKAFAVCKYIYAVDALYSSYVKRDGQVVICALKNLGNPSNLSQRVCFSSFFSKADYFVNNQSFSNSIEFNKLLKKISRGKLEPMGSVLNNRKNILFEVNCANIDTCLSTFINLSNQIDLEKFCVSIVVSSKFFNLYGKKLNVLNPNINIFVKRGALIVDEDTNKKAKFLTKEIFYFENYNQIFDFFPSYVFDYEKRKLFGDMKFETVINVGHNAFYWSFLAKSICNEVYYLDVNDYSVLTQENLIGKARLAAFYDNIYYLSKANLEKAVEYNPIIKEKAQVLEYLPAKNMNGYTEAETVKIKDELRLITKVEKNEGFDSFDITTVKYFEKGEYSYVIPDGTKGTEENLALIKFASEHADKIIVFDHYLCLAGGLSSSANVKYFNSYEIYMSLLSRLGTCYTFFDSKSIIEEAKALDKEIITFNPNS